MPILQKIQQSIVMDPILNSHKFFECLVHGGSHEYAFQDMIYRALLVDNKNINHNLSPTNIFQEWTRPGTRDQYDILVHRPGSNDDSVIEVKLIIPCCVISEILTLVNATTLQGNQFKPNVNNSIIKDFNKLNRLSNPVAAPNQGQYNLQNFKKRFFCMFSLHGNLFRNGVTYPLESRQHYIQNGVCTRPWKYANENARQTERIIDIYNTAYPAYGGVHVWNINIAKFYQDQVLQTLQKTCNECIPNTQQYQIHSLYNIVTIGQSSLDVVLDLYTVEIK